jgi:hypothetical protein
MKKATRPSDQPGNIVSDGVGMGCDRHKSAAISDELRIAISEFQIFGETRSFPGEGHNLMIGSIGHSQLRPMNSFKTGIR